jgi:hypothetical protein
MKDIINHTPDRDDSAAVSNAPAMVSLTDWAATTDQEDTSSSLTILKLSAEPVYVSLFTDQGADVTAHYLERTESWAGGYVYCLGISCPACAAQIDRKRFVLLPVADLTDARIKILRVPSEKGPGKLLTEMLKVLGLANRAEVVTKISRTSNFQYIVDAHRQDALSPDVLTAIKRFADQLNDKIIDLRSAVTRLPDSEIAQHERIAKRLALEGRGQ